MDKKQILIVVDAQNDFIDGALANKEAQARVPNIVKLIKSRDWDGIFYTMDTHGEIYEKTLEGKKLPIRHCIASTDGWKLNSDIARALELSRNEATELHKLTFGTFDLRDLIHPYILKEEPEITICGFCTDICIVSNALILRAQFPDAIINVVEDACAGVTEEKHKAALSVMESCQIDIKKTSDYVKSK